MMNEIFTVSKVNSYIKNMFLKDYVLNRIYMKGEVSNCKYHASGHIYFTLKDEGGQMACVMFAGSRSGLDFRLAEGQAVIVFGGINVYERDGKYQMYAKEIKRDGIGLLYERFEEMKRNLANEGLFQEEHKKPIPFFPKRVGIVTAVTGAVIRDIVTIARRRNPYIQLILAPAFVQGDGAAASIVAGIQRLERMGVDLMIVGRGGGSIEDLWAFNEESVVRSVYNCSVPIISAVGHETDTTLSDYVADLRAPTPSAAAELGIPEAAVIQSSLVDYHAEIYRMMLRRIHGYRSQSEKMKLKLQTCRPINRLDQRRQLLMHMEEQLNRRIKQIVTVQKQCAEEAKKEMLSLIKIKIINQRRLLLGTDQKLLVLVRRNLTSKQHKMEIAVEKLKGLSPLDKLVHGYAYVSDEHGKVLNSVHKVKVGQKLHINVMDGELRASVTSFEKKTRGIYGKENSENTKKDETGTREESGNCI